MSEKLDRLIVWVVRVLGEAGAEGEFAAVCLTQFKASWRGAGSGRRRPGCCGVFMHCLECAFAPFGPVAVTHLGFFGTSSSDSFRSVSRADRK
jgi:hypothetical protein